MTTRADHRDRSRPARPAPTSGAGPESRLRPDVGAIDAWLDGLVSLTRLPARDSAEIRDELDAHLRERVRDLMLTGTDEAVAVHQAISELGDMALLAQRLRGARGPSPRRIVMHAVLFTVAGAALALGVSAWHGARQPASPMQVDPWGQHIAASGAAPAVPAVENVLNALGVGDQPAPTVRAPLRQATFAQACDAVAQAHGADLYVHWNDLEEHGFEPDTAIGDLPPLPTDRLLGLVSDRLGLSGADRIAFRVDAGLLEVASGVFFDRRERCLVTYDISTLVPAARPLEISAESMVLRNLITSIVEPDGWSDNGGDVASVFAAGTRLFVSAPPRIHERVAWVLRQLDVGKVRDGEPGEPLRRDGAAPAPASLPGAAALAVQDLDPFAAYRLRLLMSRPESTSSDDTGPWHFLLSHKPASEVAHIVQAAIAHLGGRAVVDERTNAVIVAGDLRVHAVAAAVLGALDIAPAPPG
jgi:hypothetical protein